MCVNLRPSRRTQFTGYKIARLIEGKLYSPFSGVEYKIGNISTKVDKSKSYLSLYSNVIDGYTFYNESFKGFTAVFMRRKDAKKSVIHTYLGSVNLRMTISKDLHLCEANMFGNRPRLIAGRRIDEIEVLIYYPDSGTEKWEVWK